jgi:DNA-binding NtrC family response regulator
MADDWSRYEPGSTTHLGLGPTHLGLAHSFVAGQRRDVASTSPATILVLYENAAVQDLIDQALRESGHRVLSTENALEALEVVRRIRIDVLVAGGLHEERRESLVAELRSVQPDLRIVSIYGPDDTLENVDRNAGLSSPVSLDELRELVTANLDHPSAR